MSDVSAEEAFYKKMVLILALIALLFEITFPSKIGIAITSIFWFVVIAKLYCEHKIKSVKDCK